MKSLKRAIAPLSRVSPIITIAPINGAITGDITIKVKVSSVMAL